MHLYIIRHADAVPLGEQGIIEDEKRPLTEAGQQQCASLVKALQRVGVNLDRLLTSPLVRARQTAEGISQGWGGTPPPILVCDLLAPGSKKRNILERLREQHVDSLGIIGHNPDLSELTAWLLGDKDAGLHLEKAGVACIEFDGIPGKSTGTLAWLVNPMWCDRLANQA
ncbi:MAG: phosphohistidine phosphatase SixA [Gemmataceae bacterium]